MGFSIRKELNSIKKYVLLILCFTSLVAEAQYFNNTNPWKTRRREYTVGGGLTNYMGDLGGLNRKGTNWFLFDLEFSQFKYGFYGSYRYNISHRHSSSLSLFYGKVTGSDKLTSEPYRNNRNLKFSSKIIELSWNYEFFIIRPQPGHIYNIEGAKGLHGIKWDAYLFIGIGAFYYDPIAYGRHLRYYGTEGQGLLGQKPYYNLFAVSLPMGFGGSYYISKSFKIGLETSYRWTSTDHLDDVSGNYFGKEQMKEQRGDWAAFLSDPSNGNNPNWTAAGEQRGDPKWRDGFMSVCLKVTYIPKPKNKTNRNQFGQSSSKHFKRRQKKGILKKIARF